MSHYNRKTQAVVITYKAPEKLKRCLDALKDQCYAEVIDNSPPAENILYTAGINKGIKKLMSVRPDPANTVYWEQMIIPDYILVICDDVTVAPDMVRELEQFLDANPECGIAMPLQVGADGVTVNCGGCTAAFPYGKHVIEPLTHPLYKAPYESFWANGACFLARTEMIREIGLLDENMRFICSDADYSFTARARGWKIFVVPSARCEHEADGAFHYKNDFIELTKDEDALYFMKKWITGGVFRELSAEGPHLTTLDIEQQYASLTYRIREMTKER